MSQEQDVLYHLHNIGWITPLEALEKYGCFRLADRIFVLKKQGYGIKTIMMNNGKKRFAKYVLDKTVQHDIINQA